MKVYTHPVVVLEMTDNEARQLVAYLRETSAKNSTLEAFGFDLFDAVRGALNHA